MNKDFYVSSYELRQLEQQIRILHEHLEGENFDANVEIGKEMVPSLVFAEHSR